MMDPCTLYAHMVHSRVIIAGPWVRAAAKRHLTDLQTGEARGLRFDHAAASRVYRYFQKQLRLSEGQFQGRPFVLHPPQYFILGSLFGWMRRNEAGDWVRRFRRAYIEMGKGNGKSPLVGGIGLYGMDADMEAGAQIYSAGATFDQASILFNDAVKMAQQSPALKRKVDFTGNAKILNMTIMGRPQMGAFFRPLSREKGKTGSGPRPHMALCDELHEHPSGDLLEMLERGFKFRRQPLLVMITNSGSDRKSICWEEHEHACKVACGEKEDDTLFAYVCALDEGDDPLTDPRCWIKANPLLGVIITNEYLAGVVKQAKDLPGKQNNILRLHFCVWTDAATAWISRQAWERCEDPSMKIEQFRGRRCWAGLDLSATKDMTAKAVVFEDGWKDVPDPEDPSMTKRKGCYALFVRTYTPAETLAIRAHNDRAPYDVWVRDGHLTALPGAVIRYDYVAKDLVDLAHGHDLQGVAYDQWLIRTFQKEVDELGASDLIHMTDHPQGVSRRNDSDLWMPGSIDAFEDLILEERLRVHVNPCLRSAVAGATIWKSPADLRRFDKAKATSRIDACVAAAMAIGLATLGEEERISVYDQLAVDGAPVQSVSVFDQLGEIDYEILNDLAHPRHKEMLERFNRRQELYDFEDA